MKAIIFATLLVAVLSQTVTNPYGKICPDSKWPDAPSEDEVKA